MKLSPEEEKFILDSYGKLTIREIAKKLNRKQKTIIKILQENNEKQYK